MLCFLFAFYQMILNKNRLIHDDHHGFTLIELLVTITILAILITIIVVLIDPAEIFKKTRDARRIADLSGMRDALTFVSVASGGVFDADGGNISTCSDEGSRSVYVSAPQEITMHSAPSGWMWKQVAKVFIATVGGTGWIPVNFTGVTGGSSLFNLPIDPRNVDSPSVGSRFFYSYACRRADSKFELNAKLESADFGPGGGDDKSVIDGGDVSDVYEIGSSANILPTSGVY